MLTPAQLQDLLSGLESDRVERTTSTNNTDKFAEAVCAFANDLPHHKKPGLARGIAARIGLDMEMS